MKFLLNKMDSIMHCLVKVVFFCCCPNDMVESNKLISIDIFLHADPSKLLTMRRYVKNLHSFFYSFCALDSLLIIFCYYYCYYLLQVVGLDSTFGPD